MTIGIGNPRIFSMSADNLVGQMWSHYAAAHRGYCLELSGFEQIDEVFTEQRVSYTTDRPQVFLDDVLQLEGKSERSGEVIKKLYCVKSAAWQYEDEYRLIARDAAAKTQSCFLALPDGDFYVLPQLKLRSIYFGQNCSQTDKNSIKSLIANLVPNKKQRPALFSIRQAEEDYDLEAIPEVYDYNDFLASLAKVSDTTSGSPWWMSGVTTDKQNDK
jgi:hypothetical protein